MEKHLAPAACLQPGMPFITWSATGGADETTRKLIRSHVRRGKKQKKTAARRDVTSMAAKRSPRGPEVSLATVVDMYTTVQPGRIGATLCFVDCPVEIEQSMLVKMAQGSCPGDSPRFKCSVILI